MKDYQSLPPDLPIPVDDGAAAHLKGRALPRMALPATGGGEVMLAALPGRTVVYIYPRTGVPGEALIKDWDMIPGARGCTPQSCAFRDHHAELVQAGAGVFGLSSNAPAHQAEAAARLHLPFPLLSDAGLLFARALRLPAFEAGGEILLKRVTLIVRDGVIEHVFYPVFPPDKNAADVLDWLRRNPL